MFFRNIYFADELEKMDIETEQKYTEIIYRLLEYYPLFEKAIEDGDICDEVRSFLIEDLNECYSTIKELKEDICHAWVPKRQFSSKKPLFSEKLLAFLYSSMVGFCKTDKVKGIHFIKEFYWKYKGNTK